MNGLFPIAMLNYRRDPEGTQETQTLRQAAALMVALKAKTLAPIGETKRQQRRWG